MVPLVSVAGVRKRFGGVAAITHVSFELEEGGLLGLIGPNGSGKTTLLNTLNGAHQPDEGSITIGGRPSRGLRPHQLCDLGVMRTFQNPRVFQTVSAYHNLMVPMLHRRGVRDLRRRAMELLEFVGLEAQAGTAASELSGGQQKLLEFARALMTSPRLVLMDEPFAGVHPQLKLVMLDRIRQMSDRGTAFIVVSHEIPQLMDLSRRVICMSSGVVIADGTPQAVCQSANVVEAYLGSARWSA